MVVFSMRCPKCGLIQTQSPTCKSCGTAVGEVTLGRAAPEIRRAAAPPRPTAPPQAEIRQESSQTGAAVSQGRRFSFHGTGGSLFGIQTVNIFLTIVTLGIYSFWAKVKVRSFLLSQTEFEGDRFAYHGTGKELLIGTLKASLIFGIPIAAIQLAPTLLGGGVIITIVAVILNLAILAVFVPFAMVGVRRYRLSRVSWRAIRFSFRGRVVELIKLFIGGMLLTIVTLGLYYPIFETRRYAFMVSHSYFGNQKLNFDGEGRDLFWSYLLAILLSFPTLGLYWFWFLAKKQRYLMEHTSFATARFHATVTGGSLLVLYLSNLLLLAVTLGVAFPWVMVRSIRFAFSYFSLEGPLDVVSIQQEAQLASTTGEGLAGFLDMDFDFG